MDWWTLLGWAVFIWIAAGSLMYALLLVLWIVTIVVMLVGWMLTGEVYAPDWLEEMWDAFGEEDPW